MLLNKIEKLRKLLYKIADLLANLLDVGCSIKRLKDNDEEGEEKENEEVIDEVETIQ